ncbi:Ras-related and estrogen-regulated growth inhibitor [Sciurus carolinensis]|uniref:Ras-related and estrogen-regulated growth inhibitor n=1 Tax=Sciurus carolinensis TaxID=30640 RepID=A0AA41N5W4_SCICA|nr:Ras-related and estrogen-regulated growth inhibitor [Sciurus carolinensis]
MLHSCIFIFAFLDCIVSCAAPCLISHFKDQIKSYIYLPFCLLYLFIPSESTYRHQATIDDEVVSMEILDTAGQEDTIQREGHMRWGEGFVLVYDITDRGSFEEVLPLKNILDEIKKPKNVTLILVGNKADLDHSRQVSTEEGEKLATELACAFYECSACTGEGNITEIFYELCREVRRRRMVQGKTRRRSSTTHVKQAINKMLTKISS